jgi:hypothetical protein
MRGRWSKKLAKECTKVKIAMEQYDRNAFSKIWK